MRMKQIILIPLIILLIIYTPLSAQKEPNRKDNVKVALLVRFLKYITWPNESEIGDKTEPFIIGILGDTPITPLFEIKNIFNNKIKGKTLKVKNIENFNDIDSCQILFIADSYKEEIERVLAITAGKPVLTVADSEGYAEKGVHLNILMVRRISQDGKRTLTPFLEINASALLESGLKIDPRLLKIVENTGKIINPIKVEKK